jgi:phosphohistidine phosphatase
MNLYFLRHASAGSRRANPVVDVKRPLDKEGLQQCLYVANLLNSLDVQFDAIISSPLKRALQTASRVGNEIGFEGQILQAKELSPSAQIGDFRKLIAKYSHMDNVLVVGHNPNLAAFLGSVLEGNGKPLNIRLRKSGLARVDLDRRPAMLQWLMDPRIMKMLYAKAGKSARRKTSRK